MILMVLIRSCRFVAFDSLFSRAYNRRTLLKMSFLSQKKDQTDDEHDDHEVKLTGIVSFTYSQNNGEGE